MTTTRARDGRLWDVVNADRPRQAWRRAGPSSRPLPPLAVGAFRVHSCHGELGDERPVPTRAEDPNGLLGRSAPPVEGPAGWLEEDLLSQSPTSEAPGGELDEVGEESGNGLGCLQPGPYGCTA